MVDKNIKAKKRASSGFVSSKRKPKKNQKSHHIFDDVLGFAETLLQSRKSDGAVKLHEIAEATRGYAASMLGIPIISEQVDVASGSIDDFANYIDDNDTEQMIEDAGTFARSRPIATFLVALAAGLAATRLLVPLRANDNTRSKRTSGGKQKESAKRRGSNGAAEAHL